MRLLYPAEPFNPRAVDEVYADEFAEAKAFGFPTSTFSFEDFEAGDFRPRPALETGERVLYRGWMMTPSEYTRLHSCIVASGGIPVTDPVAYRLCHYLPEWYPLFLDETAETRFYAESDDLVSDLTKAGWNGCFLKDHVKSLSTDGGSALLDLAHIPSTVDKMRKYRGTIEGGLCARRLENYDCESERRYFVWAGIPYSDSGDIPPVVKAAAERISSPFFTVDVARRADGVDRIVELGDGQVSDRKHWSSHSLLSMLKNLTTSEQFAAGNRS